MEKASSKALAAVRAIKNLKRWGHYATARFLAKNDAMDLFSLVVAFERRRQS